jgi:hypothetical protein
MVGGRSLTVWLNTMLQGCKAVSSLLATAFGWSIVMDGWVSSTSWQSLALLAFMSSEPSAGRATGTARPAASQPAALDWSA